MSAPPAIAVVGTGPVARALAAAYAAGGGTVAVIVSRDASRAAAAPGSVGAARGSDDLADALAAEVVLIAVPDRALAEVAARFASIDAAPPALLLHTSGALAGAALARSGRRAGSLHPLQSFPALLGDETLAARVAGTHFFHEGDGEEEARAMVALWRGAFHRLAPGAKPLYHAGAAVLSNHTVALFDAAATLFERAGVPRGEAQAPLAALLAGTSANLAAVGVPAALTGPVARGDVDIVRAHLEALAAAAPELLESYVAMARRAVVVGRAKGSLSEADAAALERLFSSPDR